MESLVSVVQFVLQSVDQVHSEESKTGILSGTCTTEYAFLPKDHFIANSSAVLEEAMHSLRPSLDKLHRAWLGGNDIPFLECVRNILLL